MSDKTIQRIEQLIALAASDQIEEARSAAHKACQMIRDGKFRIVMGNGTPIGTTPPSNAPWTPGRDPMQDFLDIIMGGGISSVHRQRAREREQQAEEAKRAREKRNWEDDLHPPGSTPGSTYSNPFRNPFRAAHVVYSDPVPQDPRPVVNPGMHGSEEHFKSLTSSARCDGKCGRLLEKGEEAWHSRFEIRCIRCGPFGKGPYKKTK